MHSYMYFYVFFFNDTATTEIYTLSLHDALPISCRCPCDEDGKGTETPSISAVWILCMCNECVCLLSSLFTTDRKSTRLNSSHANISYAVFCLKKKKNKNKSLNIKTK